MANESLTNQEFWNELCGTYHFRQLGLTEISPESIAIFDKWYMDFYPFLDNYLHFSSLSDKKVLEIGLGFGTIGEKLFLSSKDYTGADLSEGPVAMMNQRIKWQGKEATAKALVADALNLSFGDNEFDSVVSIGCLHHTGNLPKAINEVYRVLKPGGTAIIMIYNKHFLSATVGPLLYLYDKLRGRVKCENFAEYLRWRYDADTSGRGAPMTVFTSRKEAEVIFSRFASVAVASENFRLVPFIPRNFVLNTIGKMCGTDWYITAKK